jgi:hypothetical protein
VLLLRTDQLLCTDQYFPPNLAFSWMIMVIVVVGWFAPMGISLSCFAQEWRIPFDGIPSLIKKSDKKMIIFENSEQPQ